MTEFSISSKQSQTIESMNVVSRQCATMIISSVNTNKTLTDCINDTAAYILSKTPDTELVKWAENPGSEYWINSAENYVKSIPNAHKYTFTDIAYFAFTRNRIYLEWDKIIKDVCVTYLMCKPLTNEQYEKVYYSLAEFISTVHYYHKVSTVNAVLDEFTTYIISGRP